ncbi:hypothetical protein NC651_025513 [Populus alba x Populus x berolinensis]|nr:hypothetical protein NC651_025513 [Populus alba x Populus x berolinensis]
MLLLKLAWQVVTVQVFFFFCHFFHWLCIHVMGMHEQVPLFLPLCLCSQFLPTSCPCEVKNLLLLYRFGLSCS